MEHSTKVRTKPQRPEYTEEQKEAFRIRWAHHTSVSVDGYRRQVEWIAQTGCVHAYASAPRLRDAERTFSIAPSFGRSSLRFWIPDLVLFDLLSYGLQALQEVGNTDKEVGYYRKTYQMMRSGKRTAFLRYHGERMEREGYASGLAAKLVPISGLDIPAIEASP